MATILIKKYENRRLYDATNSRYVNLDDVAQMLQRGNDVRVVDAVSGEDITRLILTQIIVEGAKSPGSSFPLDILRQMVIASGQASQESAQAMSPALDSFEFVRNPGFPAGPQRADNASAGEVPAQPAGGQKADEVKDLKQRVAELETLVASLAAKPQSARTRKPSGPKK